MTLLAASCQNLIKELRHKICVEQRLKRSQMQNLKIEVEFKILTLPSKLEVGELSDFLVCSDNIFGNFIYLAEYSEVGGGWIADGSAFSDKVRHFVGHVLELYNSNEKYCEEDHKQLLVLFSAEFTRLTQH